MQNETETATTVPGVVDKDIEKLKPSTIEVFKAMDRGMTAKEATYLVKGKNSLSYQGEYNIKEKYKKWSLVQPSMVKAAHKAIKETLAMRPVDIGDGKQMFPSHTNRLAAAAMVADRVEPLIHRNENINVNLETPVDLDVLKELFNRG